MSLLASVSKKTAQMFQKKLFLHNVRSDLLIEQVDLRTLPITITNLIAQQNDTDFSLIHISYLALNYQ